MNPVTILDQFGRPITASNRLIRAATQTTDRKQVSMLDRDTHRNLSQFGRRTLMTIARYLYWNFPAVKGAIDEQADLAVSSFVPQYYGANKKWGDAAEEWLYEWAKICNLSGWPYEETDLRRHLLIWALVDGDIGVLKVKTANNYPMIQTVMAHRIGGAAFDDKPFNGGQWIDGAYVSGQGRTVGYGIVNDNFAATITDRVAANDMLMHFLPDAPDQVRGISALASGAFDWQDVYERRQFELIAQKVGAAIALIEKNEDGGSDRTKQFFQQMDDATRNSTTGAVTALQREEFDGGMIKYFRAGSGAELQAFRNDRPSADAMAHEMEIVRSCMAGMNWSIDFSLDPTKAGGANLRMIVEKINRRLNRLRSSVGKCMRSIHGWALSVAINNGDLPPDPDWWKWEYQGPRDITADAKYDAEVAKLNIDAGVATRKERIAERGDYWEEVDAQRETEVRSDLTRAKNLSEEFGITIQEALTLLRPPTPNGLPNPPAPATDNTLTK